MTERGHSTIDPSPVGDQGRLALAEDDAQGVFAAWIENRKSGTGLYAQHLNADGGELWESGGREVSPRVKASGYPRRLALKSGPCGSGLVRSSGSGAICALLAAIVK